MTEEQTPRFLLTAPKSGSGKTLVTCGILAALRKRGLRVSSFKCGPDYIDPMFHSRVLEAKSRNLDTFFTDEETTRYLMKRGAEDTDISVVEGVMGYYDGLGGIDTKASAYDLAAVTGTPAVLVVDTRGMSLSALAEIKGFLTYKKESHIEGVILNRMSPMLYPEIKKQIEEELGIRVFGYVPKITELNLESRHLGLVLPDEVKELSEKFNHLAEILEKSLDIDGLIGLAKEAEALKCSAEEGKTEELPETLKKVLVSGQAVRIREEKPRIAVAKDEAFCFIYEDNLGLLKELGAEITFFSPLHDPALPEGIDGLLLYGGYPELYAGELSGNVSMRQAIRTLLKNGFPCLAECGGFMYLHTTMEDMDGKAWEMADVIDGKAYKTEKLGRFGYIELSGNTEDREFLGKEAGILKAHEFHYFDSTSCGTDFHAKKPLRKRSWDCIHGTESQLFGFPHLYYYSNPALAAEFLSACVDRRQNGKEKQKGVTKQ